MIHKIVEVMIKTSVSTRCEPHRIDKGDALHVTYGKDMYVD
jgi:hypothetical protein